MSNERRGFGLVLYVAAIAVLAGLCVATAVGCSSLPAMDMGPAIARALPETEIDRLNAERDRRVEELLEQRIPVAIEDASRLSAEEAGRAMAERLDTFFRELEIDDVDLQARIRDAVETEVPAIVEQSTRSAAERATDPFLEELEAEREQLAVLEADVRELKQSLPEQVVETAKPLVPFLPPPWDVLVGALVSIGGTYLAMRRRKAGTPTPTNGGD